MTPLKKQEALQKKILHTAAYDDTLSNTAIAKRHKVTIDFVRKTITGEKIYPGYYQATAKRYSLPIDEVVSQMEGGKRWCRRCHELRTETEFFYSSNGAPRHRSVNCRK